MREQGGRRGVERWREMRETRELCTEGATREKEWREAGVGGDERQLVVAPVCAQLSLQVLAGESPAMVTPESHVAYTQYRK